MAFVGAFDEGECGNPAEGGASLGKVVQRCVVFAEKLIQP